METNQPTENDQRAEIKKVLEESKLLIEQNNALLRRMNRLQRWSLWFKTVTFLIFIGAPFILYYWILEPYFTNLGSSFDTFQSGLQEIPGWKQFYDTIGGVQGEE